MLTVFSEVDASWKSQLCPVCRKILGSVETDGQHREKTPGRHDGLKSEKKEARWHLTCCPAALLGSWVSPCLSPSPVSLSSANKDEQLQQDFTLREQKRKKTFLKGVKM